MRTVSSATSVETVGYFHHPNGSAESSVTDRWCLVMRW
jgi:hypothetical protein